MSRTLILPDLVTINVVTREEVAVTTDKLSIDIVIDNGACVIATISFFNPGGYTKNLLLWEGESYIAIGQWTDEDVNTRISELLSI